MRGRALLCGSMPLDGLLDARCAGSCRAGRRRSRPTDRPGSRSAGRRAFCVSLSPDSATLSALTTMTKSPVSTCGAKVGLCLPRSRVATWLASRPSTTSVGVDDVPLALDLAGLGAVRTHGRMPSFGRKSTGVWIRDCEPQADSTQRLRHQAPCPPVPCTSRRTGRIESGRASIARDTTVKATGHDPDRSKRPYRGRSAARTRSLRVRSPAASSAVGVATSSSVSPCGRQDVDRRVPRSARSPAPARELRVAAPVAGHQQRGHQGANHRVAERVSGLGRRRHLVRPGALRGRTRAACGWSSRPPASCSTRRSRARRGDSREASLEPLEIERAVVPEHEAAPGRRRALEGVADPVDDSGGSVAAKRASKPSGAASAR